MPEPSLRSRLLTDSKRPARRLDPAQRQALLDGMRSAKTDAPQRSVFAMTQQAEPAPSFEDLEGFEAIRIQQGIATSLGIANPFYRLHEERAGATSRIDGRDIVNFTSYDYLGLNGHPQIVEAVAEAAMRWGTSVSASRLTSGERPVHHALEGELTRLYGAQAALAFVGGHGTNLAVIGTVAGPRDLILHDELAHNSIFVGAQMSGAQRMAFAHNDPGALERLLQQHRAKYRHCLIVSEGLFSMDGDGPELAKLVEIKSRHRAWLMIDEAHSLGVLGRTGRGIFEEQGIDPRNVDIWMGTLSKTLVSCGGYVAGPAALIEFLKFQAPGMVYSVGLPPTAAVAASQALDLMLAQPERVERLRSNGQRFLGAVRDAGFDPGSSWGLAVAPVFIGDSLQTVLLSERMMARGCAAVPVFAPGVPEGQARLRFFLSASHTGEQIDAVITAMTEERGAVTDSGLSVSRVAADAIRARSESGDG